MNILIKNSTHHLEMTRQRLRERKIIHKLRSSFFWLVWGLKINWNCRLKMLRLYWRRVTRSDELLRANVGSSTRELIPERQIIENFNKKYEFLCFYLAFFHEALEFHIKIAVFVPVNKKQLRSSVFLTFSHHHRHTLITNTLACACEVRVE